ncbi:MAG: sulfotransferase family 2 domain-containing protein [Reichenbachiella sp.]|uniref:sulfotransferase family 2 domain-containing protein n=1 Tax=Reichenbachiella sp. TaxID=2184521 RepID=UPI003296FE23
MRIIKALQHAYYRNFDPKERYHITSGENYTWFRIAKNGTRSVLRMLQSANTPINDSSYVKYVKNQHDEKFKFAVIRNPWDRVVSCYCDKVQGKLLFKECWDKDFAYFVGFLQRQNLDNCDRHIMRQSKLFPVKDIDYIAKLENLNHEIKFIADKINIEAELIHKNKSKRASYQTYYNDHLKQVVEGLFQDDIRLGSYSYE